MISPPMAKVAIGFCIAGSVPVHRRLAQSRVAPPARSRSRDACQVEKEKPRRGGGKFVPVRRNFQDSRGSGGPGSRPASPCPLGRDPGARGSKQSKIVQLYLLATVYLAEGVGFEPTRERKPPGGFQDRCLKPLGHPSNAVTKCRVRSAGAVFAPALHFVAAVARRR